MGQASEDSTAAGADRRPNHSAARSAHVQSGSQEAKMIAPGVLILLWAIFKKHERRPRARTAPAPVQPSQPAPAQPDQVLDRAQPEPAHARLPNPGRHDIIASAAVLISAGLTQDDFDHAARLVRKGPIDSK
jgi:hypothetical protein